MYPDTEDAAVDSRFFFYCTAIWQQYGRNELFPHFFAYLSLICMEIPLQKICDGFLLSFHFIKRKFGEIYLTFENFKVA